MYYGYYGSVNHDGTNFLSIGQETMEFPPQVTYDNKPYVRMRTYMASTPKQINRLYAFCLTVNAETDVVLNP